MFAPICANGAPDVITFAVAATEYPRLSGFLPSAAVSINLKLDVVLQPVTGLTKRTADPC